MSHVKFNRILLEISGEAMMGEKEFGIDNRAVDLVAEQIKHVYTKHVQVAISIGGSNIFRGSEGSNKGFDRTTADYIEMMATVMNGLALQDALEKIGIPTRLQSALQMPAVAESFIRRKAIRHMEKGRVVILCAGTGVPFVNTDTGASLHALELHCDVMLKATRVNGVYEQDPKKYPDAKRYVTLSSKHAIEKDNMSILDTTAVALAHENNLPIMVFQLFKDDNLLRAVSGENVGTLISNQVETKFFEE